MLRGINMAVSIQEQSRILSELLPVGLQVATFGAHADSLKTWFSISDTNTLGSFCALEIDAGLADNAEITRAMFISELTA